MKLREKHSRIFELLTTTAQTIQMDCYVVGGYVRDIFLDRDNDDIDILVIGSGIEFAKAFAKSIGPRTKVSQYANFGTAQVHYQGVDIEFVGARKESYDRSSRNPIVEEGTLLDDISRRDFTINAMAVCLYNKEQNRGDDDPIARNVGDLVDFFEGQKDLGQRTIRTPLDPDITFSDDPLRMLRAIRFAAQLGFSIADETLKAIEKNAQRIEIITAERISTELNKIMLSPRPSLGFKLLEQTGLLKLILPEVHALTKKDTTNGVSHKDIFEHSLTVLDNVAMGDDKKLWLRWAALLHDVGKPATKKWDDSLGWTFHNHNYIGKIIANKIFHRLKLPLGDTVKYVQKLIDLHMRPINLCEFEVTDSAIRRLLFEAGDDIDDLMLLCKSDLTSANRQKVKHIRNNYELLSRKLVEVEEKDRVRNFQPPVSGDEIMAMFNLPPSAVVGQLKNQIKEAILDGTIPNEREAALELLYKSAEELGIQKI